MNIRKISATVMLSVAVASCGMANNLTSDTYSSLKSFSVSKEIAGGHVTTVYGAGDNATGALFGVAGAVASTESQLTKKEILDKVIKDSKIDIKAKVYGRFLAAVKTNPLVNGKLVRSGGDAVFELQILNLGLYAKGPFSSKMEPDINIRATLKTADGKQLWTNFAYVTALNFSGHEYTFEEYIKDPAKLDKAYDAAINKAINSLVGKLKLALLKGEVVLT